MEESSPELEEGVVVDDPSIEPGPEPLSEPGILRPIHHKADLEMYRAWLKRRQPDVKRGLFNMNMNEPVIEFEEGSKEMTVSFNHELMSLVEESNHMCALGFDMPEDIAEVVRLGTQLMIPAKKLAEIARFHNTVGETMIRVQRPMMLDEAVTLSKMVKEQSVVTWGNPVPMKTFINNLMEVVESLGNHNKILTQCHHKIMGLISKLFETDLVKENRKWRESVREMISIVKRIDQQGFKNGKGWHEFIDHQLYKVLDAKFKESLLRVIEVIPDIRVDVGCSHDLLQFKPGLEEIRVSYRHHIKQIMNLPGTFEGTIFKSDFFAPITTSDFVLQIVKTILAQEDILLQEVEEKQDKFSEWLLRGTLDLEARLNANGPPIASDYEEQFKFSKQRSQDIATLNFDEDKIGCFIVSYYSLRLEIELRNREFWDSIGRSLSASVADDMQILKSFVAEGTVILSQNLQSIEDVTESSIAKERISERMQIMQIIMNDCEARNQLLLTWIKSAFDMTELKSEWREFEELLGNHQILLVRQIQNIKSNLKTEADMITMEIDTFKLKWDQLKPTDSEIMNDSEKLDEAIHYINEMQTIWYKLSVRKDEMEETCDALGVDAFDFSQADEVEEEMSSYENIWGKLSAFRNGLKEFEDEDWVVFRARPYLFEEFLDEWDSKLRAGEISVFIVEMLKNIEDYKTIIPNLKYIRGDTFTDKHWAEMFSILHMEQKALAYLKAGDFLTVRNMINENVNELKELNSRATGEVTVRQALTELDTWEIDAKFQFTQHKDSNDQPINIIEDFKSVVNKLGDNQSLLQSIRTSPYYSNFADRISIWETKLADLDEYIQNLNKIQRRWIYLEPVFSHGVLEAEQVRFRRINDEFRLVLQEVSRDNRVVSLCKQSGIRNRLSTLVDQLSRCQTSLNEFLEKKRSGFPRFYFLGDDDLLEILGQSTKPMIIQAHLKKLFAGIYNVDFDDSFGCITAMKSLEDEVVLLKSPVKITSKVEEWLNELCNEMRLTLKSMLLDSVADSKHNANNPHKYPSQILCLSNAIVFTDQCEEAIRSGKLQAFLVNLREDLDVYTKQRMKESNSNNKVLELKLKDLILDVIHHIEIVEYLAAQNVRQVSDWYWHKQLRFYIREDGTALIKMADAEFSYSYEYQGNAPKLVHTPLTDKCYLTLTQGMRMGLGGNPYGPAGTGKTESVKALGGILGRQVLVFNCDEGIDVKAMGRIFIGLVKCGAWGCFDEFNRLDGLTLSSVSLQIQAIQMALKQGSPDVKLMEEVVPLDPTSGIFVTLNPAGQGYGGRNKLPDNLKQLFRPVVMSHPDNELIAEVILYTEGFKYAATIGKKLVEVFNVSEKLLTPQTHYDWGLRALKTVLKGCGSALTEYKKEHATTTEIEEANTVVATLRLNTLPKLTYSDCLRFDDLIKDVFSNTVFTNLGNSELAVHVRAVYADLSFDVNENQVKKCLELYEQLQQRMGVVIVGPSCCGKSTVLAVLRRALLRMERQIKVHIMNPKAMPRVDLLGHINLDTRQWTDGVLTMKAQQVYAEPPEITSWIVCDGDIDPEWIESLNSVLDDNRLLTLPSGWRIKFGPNVNFIFETHDLSLASPATISRMGMIFMSEEDIGVDNIISTWILRQPEDRQLELKELIQTRLIKALAIAKTIQDPAIPLPYVAIAKTCLSLMGRVKNMYQVAEALIRGLSGHLQANQIETVANAILKDCDLPEMKNPLNVRCNPKTGKIEQFVADNLTSEDVFEPNEYPLVKTQDVKRVLEHIRPWLDNEESFLLTGPEGCGKSMILNYAFKQLRSTEVAIIHCSGLITPENVLQKLSQICITISTNTGRVYKSKDGERLILYFKDINLVKPDKWGTCQLVEFLRQIIMLGGFFDKNLEWVTVKGIQIVASIALGESGGRFNLSPRFISRIHICSMSEPHSDQLITLCHNYLSLLTKTYWPDHAVTKDEKAIETLSNAMVRVYNEVRKTFTPISHSHYIFTPRDLTKWAMGLMRYAVMRFIEQISVTEAYYTWCYESCRIFRDKLVSAEEKSKYTETILLPIAAQWGIKSISSWDEIKQNSWWLGRTVASLNSLVPFQKKAPSPLLGEDLLRISNKELVASVERGIIEYGRECRDLNVVIIRELMECVARFDRVLTYPSSCLLLAGRAGVGRLSTVSILATLHRALMLTLKVGRNYTIKSFKTDLKTAIQMSAIEGNKVYLVVEDFQMINVVFLDMLNSLVSSGEIPGLYSPEELENIVSTLRDIASADGYTSNLYSYFAQRVQNFLHVILIMDYTNENFIKNCQSNPALYKVCHMIWLDGWSEDSMQQLPLKIMTKIYDKKDTPELKLECMYGFQGNFEGEESRERFFTGFKRIHGSVDPSLSYPKRYATLIYNYALLYRKRRKELKSDALKLEAGISKLEEATSIVKQLKGDASEQETILAEKQAEANKAMDMISITLKNSNVQKGELEELRKKTEQEKETLAIKKAAIDEELSEIEPMVKMAQAAVGNIKNEALTEIRSLRAPPEIIRDILEGVLRLMGTRDMSWNSMKSFLAKRGVKDDIRNFDARSIETTDRDAVEKMLKLKQASFDPKNAKRASAAAAPLADWVVANAKFAKVLEKIGPLEKYKETLEQNLKLTESDMSEISSGLTTVDEKVKALTERYKQCSSEAMGIQFNLDKAKSTLAAAEGLVGKLNEEYTRWKEDLRDLEISIVNLPFHTLMASAFITYLSNASEDVRVQFTAQWCEFLGLKSFDFCKFLGKEGRFLNYHSLGLPSDRLSRENALIIIETCQRSYIVDPSNRATEWLITQLKELKPVVISLQDPKFQSELELAVRFGKALVVTEADTIEPILIPILRGDLVSNGSREVLPIAEKMVDYNPKFRLYLTTRNPTPSIPPDAQAVITVVNFTTTRAGLTSQLLTTTLSSEHPELNSKNEKLVSSIENLKLQMEEVGNTLLRELASAQGNILENKELLASLNETKANSLQIAVNLKDASEVEILIRKEIDVYRPFAEFGSKLYFAIVSVSQLNQMYQFSLKSFIRLFERTLRQQNLSSTVKHRIGALRGTLFEIAYEFVCQALYKTDRMAFALHLANTMFPNKFQENEWEAFTGQLVMNSTESVTLTQVPKWVSEDCKFPVQVFISTFPELYEKLDFNRTDIWTQFCNTNDCEDSIPPEVKERLTPFQELLLINILRPDRLLTTMYNFARRSFGRRSLFPTSPGLHGLVKESTPEEPILLLVSAGSDPSMEIREVAAKTIGLDKFVEIPLGQGSLDDAFEKLRSAAEAGNWVCIKNLHLITHLLDSLEKQIRVLNPQLNTGFRLWLTSEPHPAFPKVLAQSCYKFAYESPQGVKKNMQHTCVNWTPEYFKGRQNTVRCQALFMLATMHAIVQERRTYIPQGWSTFYEFNDSDIRAGCDIIEQLFKGGPTKDIQWNYVHGIFENVIYGGRIDNEYDNRVLVAYLKEYFNNQILTGGNPSRIPFGPNIVLPSSTNLSDYMSVVESIPENDRPSFFGLPSNIEKSWQKNTSAQIINQLKVLARGFSSIVTFDKDVWAKELTPIMFTWKKLATASTIHSLYQKPLSPPALSQEELASNPIDAFVQLEHFNMFVLIQRIHRSLGYLSRVLRGVTIPTPDSFLTAQALMIHEVPFSWRSLWDGPQDATHYITALVERTSKVHETWLARSKEGNLLSQGICLSDLINPDTFFTAFKQHCARKRGLSMDDLELSCTWERNSTVTSDKLYCPLKGILLEGCVLKGGRLIENRPEDPPASEAPDCFITWKQKTAKSKSDEALRRSTTLAVPLYANESRKKLISSLDIPIQGDEAKWIKTGTAFFLR